MNKILDLHFFNNQWKELVHKSLSNLGATITSIPNNKGVDVGVYRIEAEFEKDINNINDLLKLITFSDNGYLIEENDLEKAMVNYEVSSWR